MSGDHDIGLLEFAHAFRAEVEPSCGRIHPSGAGIILRWVAEMFDAAASGEAAEVKRLAASIQRKLRLERLWRVQSWVAPVSQQHPRIAGWLNAQLDEIGFACRRAEHG